jgi:uncharacterized membrane protein
MAAIGFLAIMVGIAAVILGFHGKTLWGELGSYFASPASGASVPKGK